MVYVAILTGCHLILLSPKLQSWQLPASLSVSYLLKYLYDLNLSLLTSSTDSNPAQMALWFFACPTYLYCGTSGTYESLRTQIWYSYPADKTAVFNNDVCDDRSSTSFHSSFFHLMQLVQGGCLSHPTTSGAYDDESSISTFFPHATRARGLPLTSHQSWCLRE